MWLTKKQAAEYIGVSVKKIDRLIQSGEWVIGIHFFKPQGKYGMIRFDPAAIDDWVRKGSQNGISTEKEREAIHSIVERVKKKMDINRVGCYT